MNLQLSLHYLRWTITAIFIISPVVMAILASLGHADAFPRYLAAKIVVGVFAGNFTLVVIQYMILFPEKRIDEAATRHFQGRLAGAHIHELYTFMRLVTAIAAMISTAIIVLASIYLANPSDFMLIFIPNISYGGAVAVTLIIAGLVGLQGSLTNVIAPREVITFGVM